MAGGVDRDVTRSIRPKKISVPDQRWMDRSLSEAARLLWCILRILRPERFEFTLRDLRLFTGLSRNTFVKAIRELVGKGWLYCEPTGPRRAIYTTTWRKGKAITLPTDLLLDRTLPRPAKWIWGVIHRLQGRWTYKLLMKLTGYSRTSLIKFVRLLMEGKWLTGTVERVARCKTFSLEAANPAAAKRQKALDLMQRRINVTAGQPGNSLGQALLSEVVRLLVDPTVSIIMNGGISFLENTATGGHLQYDLFLHQYGLAMEFQGAQHAGPTERFPSQAAFQAQQERDQLKRELSHRAGVNLRTLWAAQLTIPHIRAHLEEAGVPLRSNLDELWYVVEYLERALARYRARATVAQKPVYAIHTSPPRLPGFAPIASGR